jgi:hypothetical protein
MPKQWSITDIRALARRTVEGRQTLILARGEYLRALIETAQYELSGKSDQDAQFAAIKIVHMRFYPVVQEAVTSADIAHLKDRRPSVESKRRALERNRRTNFARSAYGTIRRWLRAEGNDLMSLNAGKVTKPQLLSEAPPARKHLLTKERLQAKTDKMVKQLVGLARASDTPALVLREAIEALKKQLNRSSFASHVKRESPSKAA